MERKAQDLQKQMRETELQYILSVEKIKKDYEKKLAQYKRMNSIEALMENKESFDKIQKEADEYKQKYLNKKEEVEDLTNKIQSLGEIQKDEVDALTRKIQSLDEDLDLYKNDNPELVRLIESTEVNEESLQYTVVSLNHTIRQKEKIINDYSKNLKIIFAVNIFLLAMLIYAITLIG
ncbi:MAG: hypothetical protein K6C94_07775 [Candidatus Gastranaerophilales bacterium]|nr:hypothetical protein [Candidatus Gastranaerophilales bacterium]